MLSVRKEWAGIFQWIRRKTERAVWNRCELLGSCLNGVKQRLFAVIQEAICFNSVWVWQEADAHGHPDPTTLFCLQLIDGNQRHEEWNTQVQTGPSLNLSDLYFSLISLICPGSVSWWPEPFSQATARKRGLCCWWAWWVASCSLQCS